MRKSRQGGFSLIELMTVIIIVAILAAVALPSLMAGSGESDLRKATRLLNQDLVQARFESIAASEDRAIVFDMDNETYSMNAVVPNEIIDTDTSAVIFNRKLPPDIELVEVIGQLFLPGQAHSPATDSGSKEVRFTSTNNAQYGTFTTLPADASVTIYLQTKDGAHKSRILIHRTTGFIKVYYFW